MTEKDYSVENYNPQPIPGHGPVEQDTIDAHNQNNESLQAIIQKQNLLIQDLHTRLKAGGL